MLSKISNFLKTRAGIIIISVLVVGLAGAGAVTAVKLGGNSSNTKLSFTEDRATECVVNQSCNLSLYVNNPLNKKLSCVATYTDKFGLETEFQSVGLTFKPTEIGDVHIIVQAEDGESIETDMKVVEDIPEIVTVEERICYLDSTLQFSELLDNIIYNSYSKPNFEVTTIEFGAEKMDMKGKSEYTFTEVGGYTFRFRLSNETGAANGSLIVRVKPEPTEKEKDDLTNGSYIYAGSIGKLGLSKDFHAENSDWAWSIKASPAGSFDTTDGSYWMSGIMIPFDREFDAAKQYFTMDLFANENTEGICIQYINDAGQIVGSPMGYQNVIGEWTTISSRGLVSEGTYGGIQIAVLHKMEGKYDASNVMAYIDNLYIHDIDLNAPIIVGGTEDYSIDSKKQVITWKSKLTETGNGNGGNYVQFNKKYKNESLIVTMPIGELDKAGVVLGARTSGASVDCDKNQGVFVKIFNGFFEVFGPNYWDEKGTLGAEVLPLEKGKTYTFTYSVETVSGKDTLYLKVQDVAGKTILNYSLELPKGAAPESGNLVVWSRVANMKMQYEGPKVVERKIVDSNAAIKVGGADDYSIDETKKLITWQSTLQDNGSGNFANYAQFNKKYTNESLTVVMPVGDLKNAGLVLGARTSGADTRCDKANGIFIKFFEGFFEVFGPGYYEESGALGAEVAPLEKGKTYTFTYGVETVSGKDTLYLQIINSDKQKIVDYKLELPAGVAPTSGNLVVWSRVESMTMQYEEPKVVERPVVDENAAIKVGGADEYQIDEEKKEVTWKSSLPQTSDGSGGNYVQFNKQYTNEALIVTMPIGELANSGLVLGARMSGADVACSNNQGIFIKFFNGFFEVFGPSYFDVNGALGAEVAPLEKGKTYTFVYSVETAGDKDILYLKITDADNKVVVNYKLELPAGKAPASGNFAVWSRVQEMTLQYEEPVVIDRTTKPEEDNGNTKVKITGIFQDVTKLNVSGHNEIYFTTDQYMTEGTWVFYNDAKKQMHHLVASEGTVYGRGSDICWSGESYLYIQTYDTYKDGDVIYIPKGMTFTINNVTYEIAETFKMTCSGGTSLTGVAGTEPIKVTITGFAQWNPGAEGWLFYMSTDLATGIASNKQWKFYHDSGANILYGGVGAETDICWGAEKWLFIQKSDGAFSDGTVITIPKGLKFTIDETTYEIAEECKYQYSNGTLKEVTE